MENTCKIKSKKEGLRELNVLARGNPVCACVCAHAHTHTDMLVCNIHV